jgi:hypothetical protein
MPPAAGQRRRTRRPVGCSLVAGAVHTIGDRRSLVRRCRAIIGPLAVAVSGLVAAPVAGAAVASVNIGTSSGPLTQASIGVDLSCQVQHTGDTSLEFFPPSVTPGDCGTFVATGGVLFTPDFSNHDSSVAGSSLGTRTPFTAVSQTAATGAGTSASPKQVTTVADLGTTGLRIAELDSYVTGQESYRTDVTIQNRGSAQQTGVIYRAGDCYLQNSDVGFGFVEAGPKAVGCSENANNSPSGRIEEWYPITGGNNFTEDGFSTVWGQIASQMPFPDTCAQCNNRLDNGAGVSWSFTLASGGSTTFSHYTTFSPTGRTGAPPPVSNRPTPISPGRFGLPSNRRCIDKRKFTFRLRRPAGVVVKARVYINNVPTLTKRGAPIRKLTIRRLPNRGRFKVKIIATQDNGTRLITKRTYKKCRKSRVRGRRVRPRR